MPIYHEGASVLCPDTDMRVLAMPTKRRIFPLNLVMFAALTGLLLLAHGIAYSRAQDEPKRLPPVDLADYLTGPVERGESPGLIAAVIDEHGVRAIGAAGLRRQGSRSPITVNDLVHIGSNTKAMTATMLATLVADGTFPKGWETTIGDVFPKLAKRIHSRYRSVTLSQMVRMEIGTPHMPKNQWAYANQEDIRKRRYAIVRDSLKAAPAGPKGQVPLFEPFIRGCGALGRRSHQKELGDVDARTSLYPARNDQRRVWPSKHASQGRSAMGA